MVPSVCFTVPPPNKEAVEFANRLVWFGVLLKVKEADSALSGTHRTGSSVELVHRGHFRNEDCSMFSEGAKRLKNLYFPVYVTELSSSIRVSSPFGMNLT